VRQIHEFGVAARQFSDAGISLLAIDTDSPDVLHKTWKAAQLNDDAPIFPLVSDTGLGIFKQYRCYDDFEKMPMHGTFLIDGQGLIRWQDIGPEPFMNSAFLLKESKRLLAQKPLQ
jgi:alkyl hydroperoxide reductase subunit AhpC